MLLVDSKGTMPGHKSGRKAHLVHTSGMRIRPVALAVTLAGLAATAALAPAAAQAPRLRFSKPVTAIPAPGVGKENTGEPRLVALPSGRLLLSAQFQQWDCASGKPSPSTLQMCVWASDDGGRMWQVSGGDPQAGDDADFAVAPDGSVLEIGMNDFTVGPVTTGTGLGGTTVMRSTDNGRTWTQNTAANKSVVNDRPFVLATPHAVLMTFTNINGNIEVVRSSDGGKTWSLPSSVTTFVRAHTIEVNGGPVYDAGRHTVLAPYLYSTDPSCASGAAACFNVLALAASTDDGATWSSEPVLTVPNGGMTSMPQVSVDATGHRYITYGGEVDGRYHVFITDSAYGGHWSAPRPIDGAQASGMLPWTIASSHGHLDVAFYRSAFGDAAATSRPWEFVVADSRDGGRSWQTSVVAPRAYVGTGADHQFKIWDLVGLTRARDGRLVVAWTDDLGANGNPSVVRVAHSLR
jgi:hypothetical protein